MPHLHRLINGRRALMALPALVLAVVTLATAFAAPSHGAARPTKCSGSEAAGGSKGIMLRGDLIQASGVSCGAARTEIKAYLNRKIASESCADAAENPGRGCRVDGWYCLRTGKPKLVYGDAIHPEACTTEGKRIAFVEQDASNA